jgi:glycosyltransferase involved in cell wall biosynthesis
MFFSVVVPVYNRPDELYELLKSLSNQTKSDCFEVIVVEDGSTFSAEDVASNFKHLNLHYFFKENTGPGDSRNFGMRQAKGDFILLFDSDCILPKNYFEKLVLLLEMNSCDFFGGTDKELPQFSLIQKAINFTMTSFFTTGGIRGQRISANFQPRSFNMGLSKKCFELSGGFSNLHPGEDPELTFKLWKMGMISKGFPDLYVYHKRRISWNKFYQQMNKFGKARPILDLKYPEYSKILFWFPTLFILGFDVAIIAVLFGYFIPLYLYAFHFLLVVLEVMIKTKSVMMIPYTFVALLIQMYAYGLGFLWSKIQLVFYKKNPEVAFPELFFKIS